MKLKEKLKQIPKKYSIRKGCFFCRGELKTLKEKILRSCDNCAKGTLKSFDKIAQGKVKEGFKDVKKMVFGENKQAQETGEALIKTALVKKRKKIEKKLRRKRLSKDEIKEGLKQFDKLNQ